MFDWFRRAPAGAAKPRSLPALEALEREAKTAEESSRGKLFNRGGDLCAEAGRRKEALVYYGRAVDAYLSAGYLGPAAAMCRKILRFAPETVRAHFTLACLAVQEGQLGDALAEIGHYVEATRRTRTEMLAVPRLRLLAAAVEDEEVKLKIAGQLRSLDDAVGSERILSSLSDRESRTEHPNLIREEGQWEKLLRAAALDPDDLWRHA